MKRHTPYTTPFILLLFSCDLAPVSPDLLIPSLGEITYEQIGYDLFSIRHSLTTNVLNNQIFAVVVGEISDSEFVVSDSIPAVYQPAGSDYTFQFEATVSTNPVITNAKLRTRYYYSHQSWIDFDTTLSTMKYPYPGTEPVYTVLSGHFAQDIDIADSVVYGQIKDYLLIHDLKTQSTSQVLISCYECITVVDNRYVFYDHVNWSLYRYDLVTGVAEQFVYHPEGKFLLGLEYYNGLLYELLHHGSTYLLIYSLSGEVQDSIPMKSNISRMTIHDGIAYFQWYDGAPLVTYDLSSRTFLEEFKPPSASFEGIRIRNGYFYFSDFPKRTIARFPLDELFAFGRIGSS